MGKTTPPMSGLMHKEKSELGNYRRALRKEDQRAFDELWVHVTKHVMPCTQAIALHPVVVASTPMNKFFTIDAPS